MCSQKPVVEEVKSESFPPITPFKCVSTAKLYKGNKFSIAVVIDYQIVFILLDIKSTICVKDPKVDKFVSGGIIKRGYWEKHIVMEAMRSVDNYPTAVFLDIGANIGDDASLARFGDVFSR